MGLFLFFFLSFFYSASSFSKLVRTPTNLAYSTTRGQRQANFSIENLPRIPWSTSLERSWCAPQRAKKVFASLFPIDASCLPWAPRRWSIQQPASNPPNPSRFPYQDYSYFFSSFYYVFHDFEFSWGRRQDSSQQSADVSPTNLITLQLHNNGRGDCC